MPSADECVASCEARVIGAGCNRRLELEREDMKSIGLSMEGSVQSLSGEAGEKKQELSSPNRGWSSRWLGMAMVVLGSAALAGCGGSPHAVRGSDVKGLDEA